MEHVTLIRTWLACMFSIYQRCRQESGGNSTISESRSDVLTQAKRYEELSANRSNRQSLQGMKFTGGQPNLIVN
jgi:hypothetical protein